MILCHLNFIQFNYLSNKFFMKLTVKKIFNKHVKNDIIKFDLNGLIDGNFL